MNDRTHSTYTGTSFITYKLRARMIHDAAQRYEAVVDGLCVGRGFTTPEDALERAWGYARWLDSADGEGASPTLVP